MIAGAAAVGLFDNDARALVQPLAHINSKSTLDVNSTVEWPAPAVFDNPSLIKSDPQAAILSLISDGPKISGNFNLTYATSEASGDSSSSTDGGE